MLKTAVLAGALVLGLAAPAAAQTIVVEGEAPLRSNIPAAPGTALTLATAQAAPPGGWYATYAVEAPAGGPYRLDAVVLAPATADVAPDGGSYFSVAVNGGPFEEIAKSEPVWGELPRVPGGLSRATLKDVELHRGLNEITFRVDALRVATAPIGYRFALDRLRLTPTALALADASVGELGVTDEARPMLRVALNAQAPAPRVVRYAVNDYFGRAVASGEATIAAGAREVTATLPELAAGAYQATATLDAAAPVTTTFARLPTRRPVTGSANRFGVTVSSPWLVPPAHRAAFASALHRMGAGYVRDEIDWRTIEPRRGAYDTRGVDGFARAYRAAGVKTLGALWSLQGNLSAPRWATTRASAPMPDDLRDGYRLGRHLGGDALEVWNEPDVDVLASKLTAKADRHAAYVKAATLGVTDRPRRPLVALSGFAYPGEFQELALQNGVASYADVWAFHGYGERYVPSGLSPLSRAPIAEHGLRRLYGADTQMWMTESGLFLGKAAANLTPAQQADQARFLVQSTVADLASATDKHFWFSGPPYGSCAAYGCFGLFDNDYRPRASYSAYAAMTSLLGEANLVRRLPRGAVFKDGRRAITVLWAPRPTPVDVPARGAAHLYDVMGAERATLTPRRGRVRVTASLDPVYVVSDGRALRARRVASDARRLRRRSAPQHIVLDQRFPARTEPKAPPFGYRLGARTRISVAVYNFDTHAHTVRVVPRAFGGWTATPTGATRIRVRASGRALVPFTIRAGRGVRTRVDYPLVFEARLGRRAVPPSVARILRVGPESAPLPLAPSITAVSASPGVLRATVRDGLSGIREVRVEVDRRRIRARYDQATGALTALLPPGRHEIWIRATNRARAPAARTIVVGGG